MKTKLYLVPSATEYIEELEETIKLFGVVSHSYEKQIASLLEEIKQLRATLELPQ